MIMRLGIKFCKWVCPNSQVKWIFKFFWEVWITQKQAAKQWCFRSISLRPKRSLEISTPLLVRTQFPSRTTVNTSRGFMPVSVSSKFYFLSASCVFSEQEWNGSMGDPICMLIKVESLQNHSGILYAGPFSWLAVSHPIDWSWICRFWRSQICWDYLCKWHSECGQTKPFCGPLKSAFCLCKTEPTVSVHFPLNPV